MRRDLEGSPPAPRPPLPCGVFFFKLGEEDSPQPCSTHMGEYGILHKLRAASGPLFKLQRVLLSSPSFLGVTDSKESLGISLAPFWPRHSNEMFTDLYFLFVCFVLYPQPVVLKLAGTWELSGGLEKVWWLGPTSRDFELKALMWGLASGFFPSFLVVLTCGKVWEPLPETVTYVSFSVEVTLASHPSLKGNTPLGIGPAV